MFNTFQYESLSLWSLIQLRTFSISCSMSFCFVFIPPNFKLFWRLLSATAAHEIINQTIGRQQRSAVFAFWRLTVGATMEIRELRIFFNVPTVLANIQLNVMPLTLVGFLVNVETTLATFDVAFEARVRKRFATGRAQINGHGFSASST
jgi:hypothetical protein